MVLLVKFRLWFIHIKNGVQEFFHINEHPLLSRRQLLEFSNQCLQGLSGGGSPVAMFLSKNLVCLLPSDSIVIPLIARGRREKLCTAG